MHFYPTSPCNAYCFSRSVRPSVCHTMVLYLDESTHCQTLSTVWFRVWPVFFTDVTKLQPVGIPSAGRCRTRGCKNLQYSTEIAVYLLIGTRQARGCYGSLIGSRRLSLNPCQFGYLEWSRKAWCERSTNHLVDLCNNACMVWPRMTKFSMVTQVAEKHVSHALHRGDREPSVPKIFGTSLHAHTWTKKFFRLWSVTVELVAALRSWPISDNDAVLHTSEDFCVLPSILYLA